MPEPSYPPLPLSDWIAPSILTTVRRARNKEATSLIRRHDAALKRWHKAKRAEKRAFDDWQFSVFRVRQYYRKTEAGQG